MAGLDLDPWQQNVLMGALELTKDKYKNPITRHWEHKWAAYEVGLMISRQNGKGAILEARELAGLFLFGERVIIHSAHEFPTARQAFERILMLIENTPRLSKEVLRVSRSHGDEGIYLKSGQSLQFRTRTKGGARGFTADTVIFDEAMILDKGPVKALMPTLLARPNSQIWYTGSAGDRDSTQFGRVRARALDQNDPRLYYAEWSADVCGLLCPPDCKEHDDPGNPETWAKANAALGIRIEAENLAALHRSMDPESFNREMLGVGDWPLEGVGWTVIPRQAYMQRTDPTSMLQDPFAIAVDIAPDRSMGCIAAAGLNEHGDYHIEITGRDYYDYQPGVQWIVDRVKSIWQTHGPKVVVIDKAGQTGSLVEELEAATDEHGRPLNIKLVHPNVREYGQACGEFMSGFVPRKGEVANITHLGQPPLERALKSADIRELADLWCWSKKLSAADITPLVAVTLARWGYKKFVYQKKVSAPWVYRR